MKNNLLEFLSINEMDGDFLFFFIIYVILNGPKLLLQRVRVEHRLYPHFKNFVIESVDRTCSQE